VEQEKVWRQFLALPAEAQQQVANFIAFLRMRTGPAPSGKPVSPPDWVGEPFVAMRREREDMQDKSSWVRRMREHEW
jgi:hypothetical protein